LTSEALNIARTFIMGVAVACHDLNRRQLLPGYDIHAPAVNGKKWSEAVACTDSQKTAASWARHLKPASPQMAQFQTKNFGGARDQTDV
jgi:hypothetical protein